MSFIGNGVGRQTIQPGQIAPQAVSYSNLDSTITPGLGGMKNKIINGNFDVWQRGTSTAAVTGQVYLADRFCSFSVGSTVTHSQQAFTLGQTAVPGEPTYFLRAVCSSVAGASNQAFIAQPIESVRTFAGQQVTLSFYAKSDASRNMAIEFAQTFGTSGSPSATVVGIGVTTLALTTSWQKFTVTANIPSIANKTITTNDNLQVTFWMDAGSNLNTRTNSLGQQSGTFDFAQVQLEAGPTATVFEKRPIAIELVMCQRYYQQSSFGGYSTTTYIGAIAPLPVVMRTNQTVTYNDQNGNASKVNTSSASNVSSTAGAFTASTTSIKMDMLLTSSAGNWWRIDYTLNAEL